MKQPLWDHVSITVSNLDRSIAFYRDLLGFQVKDRGEQRAAYAGEMLGSPGAEYDYALLRLPQGPVLELLQFRAPTGAAAQSHTWDTGSMHIAFEVPDIDALWSRLSADDIPTRTPSPVPIDHPNYDGWRCGFFQDPDGAAIEVIETGSLPSESAHA